MVRRHCAGDDPDAVSFFVAQKELDIEIIQITNRM